MYRRPITEGLQSRPRLCPYSELFVLRIVDLVQRAIVIDPEIRGLERSSERRFYVPVFVARGNDGTVASRILTQHLAVRLGNP
jgi:hypothetical protein